MIYSCSICELEIPENDTEVHLASHASRKIPFTPPTCIPSPPSPPSPPSTDTQSESKSPDSSNDPPSSPSLCIDETPRSPKSPSLDGSTTSPIPSPARLHSPELFSQEPTDLVERFLAECVEPPISNSPQPNPAPIDEWELPAHQNVPLIGNVSIHCPSPATDATHLLPQSRTIATPSAAIPPLMANIVHTPDHNQPSTCQPTPPPQYPAPPNNNGVPRRAVASDFFRPPTSQPVLEDVAEDDSPPTAPPRPAAINLNAQITPLPNPDPIHSPVI